MKTFLLIACYFTFMFVIAHNATAEKFPRHHSGKNCKHNNTHHNRQGKKQ